jgi:hypothetical protein
VDRDLRECDKATDGRADQSSLGLHDSFLLGVETSLGHRPFAQPFAKAMPAQKTRHCSPLSSRRPSKVAVVRECSRRRRETLRHASARCFACGLAQSRW